MSETTSSLTLRRAVPDDAARLAEIQSSGVRRGGRSFYAEPVLAAWAWGDAKREACRSWIGDASIQTIVCTRRETVLGFAIYVGKTDFVYLHSLYCDPDAAGRGIGRMLLHDVERFARATSKRHVTAQSSLNAIGFYQALGFHRLREGFQEIGPDKLRWDYVAMGKTLAE